MSITTLVDDEADTIELMRIDSSTAVPEPPVEALKSGLTLIDRLGIVEAREEARCCPSPVTDRNSTQGSRNRGSAGN